MLVFGLLLITSLFSLDIRIILILASQNEIGNNPPSYFCKSLGRIDIIFSLNIWWEFTDDCHLGMEYIFMGEFQQWIQLT